jgi:competence protein ComEC
MLAAVAVALLTSRSYRPATMLAVACWAVLLFDPLAVMAPGFWLSFGAVALILYGMHGRLRMEGLWWRWGRVQWLITVGLTPVLFLLFGSASTASPLANLVAVPWVSFFVVPLTLLGVVLLLSPLPELGVALLHVAAFAMAELLPLLQALANYLPALALPIPPWFMVGAAFIGVITLLAPRGWPARALGLVWCLPLLAWTPARPAQGEVWLTLLDVGQGLATVVETENHVFVYDTGPRFGESFDTGEAVVEPFLRYQGWSRLDLLVVSHGDNDHIGGARSLTEAVPVARVLTGVPQKMSWMKTEPCLRGEHWNWDGVRFEVLHPHANEATNDGSCVIRITGPGGAFLLTGDIEAPAEQALVASGEDLHARILVVPHHGSKTSSTEPFLDAVSPEFALFPLGYRNRYRFPHPVVVERYESRRIQRLDSATSGAIMMRVKPSGDLEVVSWRDVARHYWQRPVAR